MTAKAEVSIHVEVPPERVYALVSDLPRMGEWSPECVRCDWLGGAAEAAPGARFKGRNRRGVRRWSTTGEVVVAQPGKELTFDVTSVFGLPVARWSYLLVASDGGTNVTERWEDRRGALIKFLGRLASGVSDRGEHNAAGMRTTLERVKATAETG